MKHRNVTRKSWMNVGSACAVLILIFACSTHSASPDEEENAIIEQRVQNLSHELIDLKKQAGRQVELAKKLKDIEIQLDRASGDQKKKLEESHQQTRQELDQAYAAVRKEAQDEMKLQAYQAWLKDIPSRNNRNNKRPLTPRDQAMKDLERFGEACDFCISRDGELPKFTSVAGLMEELQPLYLVKFFPPQDPWGTQYVALTDPSRQWFWIISYGADGKPDPGIYDAKGFPTQKAVAKTTTENSDLIYFAGGFIRSQEEPSAPALESLQKLSSPDVSDPCSLLSNHQLVALGLGGSTKFKGSVHCQFSVDDKNLSIMITQPQDAEKSYSMTVNGQAKEYSNQENIPNLGDKAACVTIDSQSGTFFVLKRKRFIAISYNSLDPAAVRSLVAQIIPRL